MRKFAVRQHSIAAGLVVACMTALHGDSNPPLLLQKPTLSRAQIAFVYAGDLWTVPREGGDARRLTQVLDNLIANAVKFSHRNSRVRVTADYDGAHWRIDVADDGIGIPPDEAGQLFHRFVRASNARTAGLPGTGLGLSIVKVLVEMHGGRVEANSALGRGSTFRVYLPGPEDSA